MAKEMGLSLRGYEDLEAGRSQFREIHIKVADLAAVKIAIEKGDADLIPGTMIDLIAGAALLLTKEKPAS